MSEGNPLTAWESFYVILGSSAAALTGLQFVVIALVAESGRRNSITTIAAFGTPTVVHFGAALLISAIFTAPWPTLAGAATAVGVAGLVGVAYSVVVIRRARRQSEYKPVFEDWLWHTILPSAAYVGLLIGAMTLTRRTVTASFIVGGAALLFLFIGIHNAWDTVTYIATTYFEDRPPREGAPSSAPAPESAERTSVAADLGGVR